MGCPLEEQFGWPVYLISTATREGLDELKWAMWDIVKRARAKRKEQPVAEPQVIRPAFVGRRHDDGIPGQYRRGWRSPIVRAGALAERLAAGTSSQLEVVRRVQSYLQDGDLN